MATRNEKVTTVESLGEIINNSAITVCADYQGLTVAQMNDLRVRLAEAGAQAKVVKNTLTRLAATKVLGDAPEEDLAAYNDLFSGPSLLIYSSEESVGPAKVITAFAKEHEKLTLKGAWFSDAFIDEKGVVTVSTMPSKEEVLTNLVRLIATPATQLVRLLNAPGTQIVQVVNAHKENLN